MNILLRQRLLPLHLCIECIHHKAILISVTDNFWMIFNECHTPLQIHNLDLSKLFTHIRRNNIIFIRYFLRFLRISFCSRRNSSQSILLFQLWRIKHFNRLNFLFRFTLAASPSNRWFRTRFRNILSSVWVKRYRYRRTKSLMKSF